MKFTVPGFVSGTHPEMERLIFAFENARRRAYLILSSTEVGRFMLPP
jgi:hypothetical protein